MRCLKCNFYTEKENDFCKRCGAFVPRANSDVAKYANHHLHKEGRLHAYNEKGPDETKKQPSLWRKLLENLNRQQNPQMQGEFTDEPQNQGDTGQTYTGRTVKKQSSQAPGTVIFFLIIVSIFIMPNILLRINQGVYDETAIVSEAPFESAVYEYEVVDFDIINKVVTEGSITSFDISFLRVKSDSLFNEPEELDFIAKGYVEILGAKPLYAEFDGITVSVSNSALEFDTEYVLMYISLSDIEDGHERIFHIPDESKTLIFHKDGTYELNAYTQ